MTILIYRMSVPKIQPIRTQEFESKQSRCSHSAKLPTRSLILAPSGGGKTVLLQNMILDIYRDCFSRIYIFSPSIDVDMTWEPVKEYLTRNLHQDEKKEKYLFDSYQPAELERIIETQYKVVEFMKHNKMKNIYQILIIIDASLMTPALLATASCYGACIFVVAISLLALLLRLRSIRQSPRLFGRT